MVEPRALRADARRNREAIVAAARSAFDRNEHLRFDDFAALAGVGVGTLYRHFPTREALAAAVYEGEMTDLFDIAHDPTRSAVENLDAFLRGFVEYVIAHSALARTLAAAVTPSVQTDGGNQLERTLSELLSQGAADGTVRRGVAVGAVMIVLHGVGSASDRPNWVAESRATVELLLAGLKTA